MTREEAIWYLSPIAENTSLERYKEALTLAISALREQEERENPNPLTLDELRQMDGELAYFQFDDVAFNSAGYRKNTKESVSSERGRFDE